MKKCAKEIAEVEQEAKFNVDSKKKYVRDVKQEQLTETSHPGQAFFKAKVVKRK